MVRLEVPTVNRISRAIDRMRVQVEERIALGMTTEARVETTRKALDMDLGEFAKLQEMKSLACVDGTLTPDEAQYVYGLLGATPSHFNKQDVATKAVLTQMFRELLEGSVAR